jgi:hypothetical protein
VTALWINFRNDLGRDEVAKRVRTFMEGFVFSLFPHAARLASESTDFVLVFLTKDQEEYSAYPTPLEAVL